MELSRSHQPKLRLKFIQNDFVLVQGVNITYETPRPQNCPQLLLGFKETQIGTKPIINYPKVKNKATENQCSLGLL